MVLNVRTANIRGSRASLAAACATSHATVLWVRPLPTFVSFSHLHRHVSLNMSV
jgi:hypothetical protein